VPRLERGGSLVKARGSAKVLPHLNRHARTWPRSTAGHPRLSSRPKAWIPAP